MKLFYWTKDEWSRCGPFLNPDWWLNRLVNNTTGDGWLNKICHFVREFGIAFLIPFYTNNYFVWLGIIVSLAFNWGYEIGWDCVLYPIIHKKEKGHGMSRYDVISGELGTLTAAVLWIIKGLPGC